MHGGALPWWVPGMSATARKGLRRQIGLYEGQRKYVGKLASIEVQRTMASTPIDHKHILHSATQPEKKREKHVSYLHFG